MQEQHYQPFPKPNAYRDDFDPAAPLPNDPSWGSPIGLATWLASVLLVAVVPMLFLIPYVISQGVYARGQAELARFVTTDTTAILIQMAAIVPAHLITLAIGWAIVTRFNKQPFFATLGWRSGGMRWWHHAMILVGFLGLGLIVNYFVQPQENDLIRILKSSRLALYTVAFLAVFTAPFIEELIYRGILYSPLQRSVGPPLAIAIVTLLFAIVHVPQYLGTPSTIALLLLLSLILTLIRAKTGNLLPCVILHTLFNGIQSTLLILSPELQPQSTVPQDAAAMLVHVIK